MVRGAGWPCGLSFAGEMSHKRPNAKTWRKKNPWDHFALHLDERFLAEYGRGILRYHPLAGHSTRQLRLGRPYSVDELKTEIQILRRGRELGLLTNCLDQRR